ncbi:MAG: NAD(P)/FAD-dependent oxidoreductase [Candidatus Methanoliparum thermophilum]|uniref:Digeranylgeranylglycerophospholipid reductase n=1 Tax=Methanoliparum thermophilum TaxID=2491083 RepID=A0A520KSB5_METT2|nr:MAG: NAD(P)/FAD-dependent oxidoreductase [Candidatus Methanoliparum thermophilum]
MKNRYDIVVVGAGPGGSMAAKVAAMGGLDVLLVEKRQEIGSPIRCAEGVSKKGLKKFLPQIKKEWISCEVEGARIYSPDGTMVEMAEEMAGSEVGYVLERKIFDRDLATLSGDAGADVYAKTNVTDLVLKDGVVKGVKGKHLGRSFEVECNLVIGADGTESKIGRMGGIDTTLKPIDIESGVEYIMTDIEVNDLCNFYLGNDIAPGGYAWMFPKGDNMANIGLAVLGKYLIKKNVKRPIDYLNKFVKEHYKDGKIVSVVFGGIPVSRPIKTISNGIMLVGDAARFTDPITGGGILKAMESGIMAGETAIDAIEAEDFSENELKKYEDKWRPTIGMKNERNYLIKEFFINLSDEKLNDLARSINEVKIKEMSVTGLIAMLIEKNPKTLENLSEILLKYL